MKKFTLVILALLFPTVCFITYSITSEEITSELSSLQYYSTPELTAYAIISNNELSELYSECERISRVLDINRINGTLSHEKESAYTSHLNDIIRQINMLEQKKRGT